MKISPEYFDAFYEEMTLGDKQHMANKIYKDTGMYPQKLDQDKAMEQPKTITLYLAADGKYYVLRQD